MSELPRGWKLAEIRDVTEYVQRGKSPKYTDKSELPVINQKCVRWSGVDQAYLKFIHPDQWNAWSSERFLQEGDLLWNSTGTGTIGRAALFTKLKGYEKAVVDSHVTIVRCSKSCLPYYLHYFVRSPLIQGRIEEMHTGSTNQVELSREEVLRTSIPLPPLNEQRRIVTKLDRLFARSRSAREELERIPKLCDRYKQAILAAACSGRLTADWRKEKNFPASSILRSTINEPCKHNFFAPEHWEKYDLVQVCKLVGGSQPPKSMFSHTPKPGYLRLIQIRDYKSDNFITYVPKESVRRFCSIYDVMIGRYGPPIFQILRGIEGAYNVALMKAEPCLEIVSKEFIYYYLQNPNLFNYVDISSDRTAGQSGVNKAHLEKYPVFVPPLKEQTVIVQEIENLFKAIDLMKQEYQKAIKLLDRLDQATLAKAFRGELVPQDPNDEPAAALLERILAERQNQTPAKRGSTKKAR